MRKLLLTNLVMLFFCSLLGAQETIGVRPFEVELRFPCITNALCHIDGVETGSGFGFGVEFRYNLDKKALPFDFGLGLEYSQTEYYEKDSPDGNCLDPEENMIFIAAFADYNFRQAKKFNPFVGFGAGVAFCDVEDMYKWTYPETGGAEATLAYSMGEENQTHPVFIPRIGFEAWHHLRVSAYTILCKKGLSNFTISIGWSIGGGRK
jgi:opacity protein-like surface antigen